jgi:hypothetical protein
LRLIVSVYQCYFDTLNRFNDNDSTYSGVSFEAMSYAGHDGLDNLIVIYDSNDVTLDKMADFTQSEVLFEVLYFYDCTTMMSTYFNYIYILICVKETILLTLKTS